MLRSLIFGINVFAFLIVAVFQKEEVKISQNLPNSLKPGTSAIVEVEIDKSNVTGFAKYQVNLDKGLTAELIESAGASFTFNDQKAKFIWMALPDARKFKIKYRITAESNAVGNLTVDSRFSYIYDNVRKNKDVPAHAIAVGDESNLANQDIDSKPEEKTKNQRAEAKITREITSTGINQWKVELAIQKSDLQGFAKIEEVIPNGYTAIDLNSSSAVFSLDDTKVKYIWYDIPERETVFISYKLLPVIAMNADVPNINGNFSFLKNEETVVIPIVGKDIDTPMPDEELEIDDEEIFADEPEQEEKMDEVAQADNIKEKESSATDEPIAEEKEESVTELEPVAQHKPSSKANKNDRPKSPTDGNIVNVPEPEKGVYYRVQIAAGKNNLQADTFAKIYSFSEGFKLENQDGLFKYTTGYFEIYKAARDGRERITAKYDKFKGPFVAAYNDGERISVQEALMITNQKWFQ